MATKTLQAFSDRSALLATAVTDTATTSSSLVFLASAYRARKARLTLEITGGETVTVDLEFHDEVFEERTPQGEKKE